MKRPTFKRAVRACEVCAYVDEPRAWGRRYVVAHHDDYAFPLVVRWLCIPCHMDWHLEHGPAKGFDFTLTAKRIAHGGASDCPPRYVVALRQLLASSGCYTGKNFRLRKPSKKLLKALADYTPKKRASR